jgi:hypothetical protein
MSLEMAARILQGRPAAGRTGPGPDAVRKQAGGAHFGPLAPGGACAPRAWRGRGKELRALAKGPLAIPRPGMIAVRLVHLPPGGEGIFGRDGL